MYVAHAPVCHAHNASCQRPSSCAIPTSPDVIDVVRVHDAHDMIEFLSVATAMVEPGQVLRLLQNSDISLQPDNHVQASGTLARRFKQGVN